MTLQLLDYLGVFVFAMSGALLASRKQMDVFGFTVLALLPAVGGGTLRDLILDTPVFWTEDTGYLLLTLGAAIITWFGYPYMERFTRPLAWLDALGLAVFCVAGTAKALALTGNMIVAAMMGVVTAVAGGILRDTVANEVPLVLRQEVYAIAAFTGAAVFLILHTLQVPGAQWLAMLSALVLRGLGIARGWSLPQAGQQDRS
ncbi:MAG: trimeric intracellular cation channel family protein [Pseudomonadota bacterium]